MLVSDRGDLHAALALASDLRMLGHQVIEKGLAKNDIDFSGHVMMFVARTTTAFESVELLTKNGLNTDAFSIMRTICELDIDLAYILKEQTTERFRLFFGYEHVTNWLKAQAIQRLHGASFDQRVVETLRDRFEAVKNAYSNPYCWAGKNTNIKKRARATGRKHLYELAYAEGCSASHSGPQTLRSAHDSTETEDAITITIRVGRQDPAPNALILACTCYQALLDTAIESCKLTELEPALSKLIARLPSLIRD